MVMVSRPKSRFATGFAAWSDLRRTHGNVKPKRSLHTSTHWRWELPDNPGKKAATRTKAKASTKAKAITKPKATTRRPRAKRSSGGDAIVPLAIGGVVLAGGVGFWLWQSRQSNGSTAAVRARQPAAARYYPQAGRPALPPGARQQAPARRPGAQQPAAHRGGSSDFEQAHRRREVVEIR